MTEYLYQVSHSDWDSYNPTILMGPYIENWKEYCKSYISQAVIESARDNPGWIGWQDIKDELVKILEKQGFYQPNIVSFDMYGSCIIYDESDTIEDFLSEKDLALIKAHNQVIHNQVYKEL